MFGELTSFQFSNKTACRSGKWCYSKHWINKDIQDDITKTLEIHGNSRSTRGNYLPNPICNFSLRRWPGRVNCTQKALQFKTWVVFAVFLHWLTWDYEATLYNLYIFIWWSPSGSGTSLLHFMLQSETSSVFHSDVNELCNLADWYVIPITLRQFSVYSFSPSKSYLYIPQYPIWGLLLPWLSSR